MKDETHQSVYSYMKVKNQDRYIDITYEWDENKKLYRMYTDSLKYGNKLEVVFGNDENCFVIKNLDKLKEKWNTDHDISNDPFDQLLELDNGMQDLQEK